MKNFKMETVKLSKKADIKIKSRLYMLQVKKYFLNVAHLKIIMPAFALWICVLFAATVLAPNGSPVNVKDAGQVAEVSTKNSFGVEEMKYVRNDKYRRIAKQRLYTQKAKKYKQYSYVRSSSLRTK